VGMFAQRRVAVRFVEERCAQESDERGAAAQKNV
jgi:hypothetical protein